MSEKEKEEQLEFARNLLDTSKGFYVQVGKPTFIMFIDIIAEQQKEIEELKDITRAYDGMQGIMPEGHPIIIADKEYFDSGRFIEKYISKDKIRAKIKELKGNKAFDEDVYIEEFAVDILEELLEEGE